MIAILMSKVQLPIGKLRLTRWVSPSLDSAIIPFRTTAGCSLLVNFSSGYRLIIDMDCNIHVFF